MRTILILFYAFTFFGCATHQAITKSTAQLKLENKGVLTIKEPTFLQSLDPLGSHISADFEGVDSNKLPWNIWDGYPKEIEVAAGEREIEYSCYGKVRSIHVGNTSAITISVEPGKKYLFVPVYQPPYGCRIKVDEN
jgi:hypothetical protein